MAKQPAQSNGKSEFLNAFKKSPQLTKALEAMRSAKDPNARPDIEDGTYVAEIKSIVFSQRDGIPNVRLNLIISEGPYKGTPLSRRYDFGIANKGVQITLEEVFDRIGVDLIRMGVNPSDIDARNPETLIEAFESLSEQELVLRINVKTNVKGYVNVYINGLAEGQNKPKDEVEDDADSDADEDDQEADSDADTDDAEDENEEPSVEKGDTVTCVLPGTRRKVECVVVEVNEEDGTCDLKGPDKKVHTDIPLSDVELVFE
jgi:hypothetical protein